MSSREMKKSGGMRIEEGGKVIIPKQLQFEETDGVMTIGGGKGRLLLFSWDGWMRFVKGLEKTENMDMQDYLSYAEMVPCYGRETTMVPEPILEHFGRIGHRYFILHGLSHRGYWDYVNIDLYKREFENE